MADNESFTYEEVVDITIKILTAYGFTPAEQTKLMGFDSDPGDDPADLKLVLMHLKHEDAMPRSRLLFEIKLLLDRIFNEDVTVIRRWIRIVHPTFDGKSARTMMLSDGIDGLTKVRNELAKIAV